MKSVEFPQQTTVIAKDQPQYHPLPAHVANGVVTSCWEPDAEDIKRLAMYGKLYVSQLTFGGPLQPLTVQTHFNPPQLPPPEEVQPKLTPKLERKNKLADIAQERGLSGPILFAMDNQSIPGKVVCHFVRLETQVFEDTAEFDQTTMTALNPDADKRLQFLADCFTQAADKAVVQLMQVLSLTMSALDLALKVKLPPPVRDFLVKTMRACAKATETHG
jgi:hypothetical protein